jgi:hypothetical protein
MILNFTLLFFICTLGQIHTTRKQDLPQMVFVQIDQDATLDRSFFDKATLIGVILTEGSLAIFTGKLD